MLKRFLFATILFFSLHQSFAQNAVIKGFVYDKKNSEPSIYTSVYLQGTTYGVQTNLDGYFSINKIKPGKYTLTVTSVGYDTLREEITLTGNEIINKKFFVSESVRELDEITIDAEAEEKKTEVKIGVNKITPKEIKSLPSVGGEPDLAQYLQVLPGIISSGDQGGQLYIRGGTPVQNKVLLDGMVIYNPFHSIGLYSVFDADIMRNATVYTGGFNAEYGGRISSVMDITTRDGNKNRLSGKVGVNTFTSKVVLEGPLKKITDGEEGSSSFLLSVKKSYLDESSKKLYGYVSEDGLPFDFTDFYGKMSFNSSSGSKVNIFGFRFEDGVKYRNLADFSWKSSGFGSNFVLTPVGSIALIEANLAYSKYGIKLSEQDEAPRYSDINGFNLGLNFSYFYGKDVLKYGVEVTGFRTDFLFYNPANVKVEQAENTTELNGFVTFKKIIGRLILEPGMRLNYYASLSEFSPEPRLGGKINITNKFRAKFSAGIYSQNLLSTTSDRDVVNLFYGFLSGSSNLPKTFDGKEVKSKLQYAQHAIAGFEVDLPYHLNLNVEVYLKNFSQIQSLNRDKIYADNLQNNSKPDYLKKDFIVESGIAKGADLTIKYDYKKLYVWLVYSLGYSERFDGIRHYAPLFDRRHNVNLVSNYSFGKNRDWEFGLRYNLGSPFPFTLTQGFYQSVQFTNGLGTDIFSDNEQLGIYYGELNKGRLSWYHRLDLNLKKTIEFNKNTTLELTASVTNAYDRKNIFYRDRVTGGSIYQLPVLPSLGAVFSF